MNTPLPFSPSPAFASLENFTISGYIGDKTRKATTMTSEPNPQWTLKQGITYETTCEAMMHYIGMVVNEIYAEEAAETPRAGIIAALNQHIIDVKDERDALRVDDIEKVAATREKYAALLRSFRTAPPLAA